MMVMTPEQLKDRAKLAAAARWGKEFDWEKCPIDDGFAQLARLRAEAEKGGMILERRRDESKLERTVCYNPECYQKNSDGTTKIDIDGKPLRTIIDITSGRYAGSRSRHNPDTGA
jgi:hypothetical protein